MKAFLIALLFTAMSVAAFAVSPASARVSAMGMQDTAFATLHHDHMSVAQNYTENLPADIAGVDSGNGSFVQHCVDGSGECVMVGQCCSSGVTHCAADTLPSQLGWSYWNAASNIRWPSGNEMMVGLSIEPDVYPPRTRF